MQVLTSSQSKQTFPLLVIPHLYLVVVSPRDEDRLSRVEADTADGACVPREDIPHRYGGLVRVGFESGRGRGGR